MADYPPFQIGASRFDQTTFWGRFRHFLDVIDPRTLFTSKNELEKCSSLLKQYKAGTVEPDITDRELWEAQKIVQAIIHPDTGDKMFMPFRMSGFVPFGIPIIVGLLLPNQSLLAIAFWQWINQSHNAGVNYTNRNASKPTPTSKILLGYAGATTASVGIAVSLTALVKKSQHLPPSTQILVQRFIPFPAVALASTCNLVLMRYHELFQGIEVLDGEGRVVGVSRVAAKKALTETSVTRAIMPAPVLILSPLIMTAFHKTAFLRRYPKFDIPLHALAVGMSFYLALPMAISLFPQTGQISRIKVEEHIQQECSDDVLYYNKGL
jgi:tricarboxylate carrier